MPLKSKPASFVLNKQHPLAKGLAIDFPFKEFGSQRIRDTVSNSEGIFVNTPTWLRDKNGYGVDFDANTEYIQDLTLNNNQVNPGNKVTIQVIATRDSGGSGTGYGTLIAKRNATADPSGRVWEFENDNGNGGQGMAFQFWFSTQLGKWTIPYPTAGAIQNWIVSMDGGSTSNDPVWWNDGVPLTVTERVTPSGTARTDGKIIQIGNHSAGYVDAWDGKVYLVRVWNRILSTQEKQAITRDPWQIYQPVKAPVTATRGTYSQTLTDVLTLVDTLPRSLSRTLTDIGTLVDSAIKSTSRTLTDVATYVDSVIKNPARILTDATTLVDTIIKAPGKLQSEVMTLVDTYTRVWVASRTLTDVTTLVDTNIKSTSRTLSDIVTLVDSFIHSVGRLLSEVMTLVDSALKSTSRTLSEVVAFVDTLVRSTIKTLGESLTLVETFITELITTSYFKTLTEVMTLVDSTIKVFDHIISGIPAVFKKIGQIKSGLSSSRLNMEGGLSLKDKDKPSMM